MRINHKVAHTEVFDADAALGVCNWGRRRWNIESDFNVKKHGQLLTKKTGVQLRSLVL